MRIPVEPACYAWAPDPGAGSDFPPSTFVDGVLWLQSFFTWNPHCRVPMTTELRNAVSRLFPYQAAASLGRMAQAQELVSMIIHLLDRICARPVAEYQALEERVNSLALTRTSVYLDDDVWLSWCDLLAQSLANADVHREELRVFAAWVNSCVGPVSIASCGSVPLRWLRGGHDPLPDGTVDPMAMENMRSRWRQCERSIVWEVSGHQAPVALKRLVVRVVTDCQGVVLRFGSTYFNPALAVPCAVTACGTDPEHVSELECAASDGAATVRGILRTTATTAVEQASALSFVRLQMRERCAELGFEFER